ncbi:MAG: hypothetical protein K6T99_09805 [Armatimonadetes bacterium]|nr:hypothetical protein [Armatimonadota bacterium]
MIRIILLLPLVCMVYKASLAGELILHESFKGGKLDSSWHLHVSKGNEIVLKDGVAEIRANLHTYAHISRQLGVDNVTVKARIKPSSPAGISWCTSIFLVWNTANWCQMGMISGPDGINRFYAAETLEGFTLESYLEPCDHLLPHYLRIELGKDVLRYSISEDCKKWKTLRVIHRPAQLSGAPASLVVGKGFSNDKPNYSNPDLDNDYLDRGPWVTSEISDIQVEKTSPKHLALKPAERRSLSESGLDPVGKIILRGKDDPTFEKVAKFYPKMKYPKEAVGVPEHPTDIAIDHLGRLQLNYNQPPIAWIEIGNPGVPFGDEKTPIERKWLSGYIPVLTLTTRRSDIEYQQTVFGWSEGMSPDTSLVAFICLEARRLKKNAKIPDSITLVANGERHQFELTSEESSQDLQIACMKMGWPDAKDISKISISEYNAALNEVAEFWRRLLNRVAVFEVPEQRINDAYRAWLAYSQLNVDKINGIYEPHDGIGFYEENYGYSCTLHYIALDMYGLHDKAERYLDSILHFQQPDGLYTQNFGLPDMGTLPIALVEHYNFTGDKGWLSRVAPNIVKIGDWLIRKRKEAPKEGITKGLIKFRPYCDYSEPEVNYFSDAYCCVGLEKASAALEAVGMKEEAERFRKEAEAYRADILASMDAAAIEFEGRTVLPLVPENHRLLKSSGYTGGDYYGLVACCLLESEFLPANDKRAYWITDFIERKNGLIAGVCKFQTGGIDHAYTYGYLLTQLKRGDPRKVILGFYGMLAYGMTRDTYSGVECTFAVNGSNMWTLPHLYSATQQLRTLRMMLLREEGDDLHIAEAVPRAWLEDGKVVEVRRAPTYFGNVSFRIVSKVSEGQIEVSITPPARKPPKRILVTLRHPKFKPIKAVYLNGLKINKYKGETIEVSAAGRPVKLIVRYE